MKLIKINFRIIIIFSLLLFSLAYSSFITQIPQIEGKKILNPPLNLSDTNPQYINSISVIYGSVGTGSLSYTQVDDANYMQYYADYYEAPFFAYGCELSLNFNPPLIGDDYKLSVHIETSPSGPDVSLYVNGQVLESSNNIDFNVRTIEDVTSIKLMASDMLTDFNVKIYYFKLELIQPSSGPWYESFDNHTLGYFDDPNWQENYGSNYIEIVDASTEGVDMDGNALKLVPPGWSSDTEIERSYGDNLNLNDDDSLYLKFRAQISSENGGHVYITLKCGATDRTFFNLLIGTSSECGYIAVSTFDETNLFVRNTIPNQVYDFDVLFIKNAAKGKWCYNVFMNQQLEVYREVDLGDLYPHTAKIMYEMYDDGPGEFYLDNFYLGQVDNTISPVKRINPICPIYYLYVPQFQAGTDHVLDMDISFRYFEIHETNVEVSLSAGIGKPGVLDISGDFFHHMFTFNDETNSYEYKVSTSTEDVLVYYNFTSDLTDVSFILPGADPQTGVTEIIGLYDCDIEDTNIRSASITAFQQMGYDIPQDYFDCSPSGNVQIYDYRTIEAKCYGAQTKPYQIEYRVMDLTKTYSGGISFPVYGIFNLGIGISVELVEIYGAEVELSVSWDDSTVQTTKIQYDLYAPPEDTYDTKLEMPPFSVNQVTFHEPAQTTGLTATGGNKLVNLHWTANSESDFHHYNIYRNGGDTPIGTTTSTSYVDSGLADSTTYTYQVAAVNIYGEPGRKSIEVHATTDEALTPGFTEPILLSTLAIGIIFVLYRFHLRMKKPK